MDKPSRRTTRVLFNDRLNQPTARMGGPRVLVIGAEFANVGRVQNLLVSRGFIVACGFGGAAEMLSLTQDFHS